MAHRYFLPQLPPPGPHAVDGELAHHLGRVLRVAAGDALTLGDGRGGTAPATVTAVHKHTLELDVGPTTTSVPTPLQLELAFCVVRGPRVDWLLEHGTEVGVAAFRPLWTARTRPAAERLDRWQRIVLAAAGQCDRAHLPAVHAAMELGEFLASPLPPRRVVGAADGSPVTAADRAPGQTVLLIGPEGGFSAAELAAVDAVGFTARAFGGHILRTETAALVGAALLLAPGA